MRAPYGLAVMKLVELSEHETDECVLWPFGHTNKGYGKICLNGKHTATHRVVCRWHHGPPPSSRHVAAHSCGKRSCVNPRHLRWATPRENSADMVGHGTVRRGEQIPKHRLTEGDVIQIIARRDEGVTALAREFCVHKSTVSALMNGYTWDWLTGITSRRRTT